MGLVKGNATRPMLESAIVLDLGDLKRQGEEIVERARGEAERIIADAKEEAARMTAEAEAVGHERGLGQGLEEGRTKGAEDAAAETKAAYEERFNALEASWREALDRWQSRREQLLADAMDDLLDLSLKIAERVIQREVKADRSVVSDQLRAVLEMMSGGTAITVVAHPEDKAFLETVVPELIATIDRPMHATLREDRSITPGGCIVRTDGGEIDARIETQMERIVAALCAEGRNAKRGETCAASRRVDSEDDEGGRRAEAAGSEGDE